MCDSPIKNRKSPWDKDPIVETPTFPLHCGDNQSYYKALYPSCPPPFLVVCCALLQGLSPGDKLEVKAMLYALPFTIENLPGIRILLSKPRRFPCTVGTIKKLLPGTLARPRIPPPFLVGAGAWLQMFSDYCR